MKRISVITGTRAEYGLLHLLMKAIREHPDMELQIIATNMHLSPEFGYTYKEIEKDGFTINKKVECLLSSDSDEGITKSTGLALIGIADAFKDLCPDLVIILGDRYEAMAAATAALLFKIPIAHIAGGEITAGAYDDAIRHAITKMSRIHFASTELYRKRIIQMGEQPDTVFNVGALGLDNIRKMDLLDKKAFEESINFKLNKRNLLITYHPQTIGNVDNSKNFGNLLNVLREQKETNYIFTLPNSDTDGRELIKMINEFVKQNTNSISFASLGQLRYLSAIKHVDAVVGNSSSGIVEAPCFRKATINIGKRQEGRIKADSIIDCGENEQEIYKAFQILYSKAFNDTLKNVTNPYGEGNTVEKIMNILAGFNPVKNKLKSFYNFKTL